MHRHDAEHFKPVKPLGEQRCACGRWNRVVVDTAPESTYESLHVFHNSVAGTRAQAIDIAPVISGVKHPTNNFIANNVFFGAKESVTGNPGAFILGGNAWINGPIPAIAGDVSLEVVFTDELLQQMQVSEAQPLAPLVGAGDDRVGLIDDFLCSERDTALRRREARLNGYNLFNHSLVDYYAVYYFYVR